MVSSEDDRCPVCNRAVPLEFAIGKWDDDGVFSAIGVVCRECHESNPADVKKYVMCDYKYLKPPAKPVRSKTIHCFLCGLLFVVGKKPDTLCGECAGRCGKPIVSHVKRQKTKRRTPSRDRT